MPHRPVILLLCDTGFARAGFSSGPANELIQGIDGSRRGLGEFLCPLGVTQRPQIQEHRHASAGLLTMDEGAAHKEVGKPVGAIGRVRDDVLGKRAVGFQEVLPPKAETSVDEVGRNHFVPCLEEHLRDGSVSASGLPDAPLEGLDGQKGSDCFRRGWVEVVWDTPWIAKIQVRNF